MTVQTIAAFALVSLLIELTPGPNMTYLAALAVRHGRGAGFAAVGGVALGLAIVGVAAALGVAALVAASPLLYGILRWGGVADLLYLAWQAWIEDPSAGDRAADGAQYFRTGLITNLLNPKAAVFYVAVLPGFLPAGSGWADTLLLAAIYVAIATAVHASIVALAGTLEGWFAHESRLRIAGRVFAIALVAVAAWLAWSTR